MTCALATAAVAVTLATAPMCVRADRTVPPGVMAALVGGGEVRPGSGTDPAFEAAIRAIRAPAPRTRRHRR